MHKIETLPLLEDILALATHSVSTDTLDIISDLFVIS